MYRSCSLESKITHPCVCYTTKALTIDTFSNNRNRQRLLDVRYSFSWIQALWTCSGAIQNGVTSIQRHTVVQHLLPLCCLVVSAINQPSVSLKENCRAEILLRIPPIGWTSRATTSTQNAFVESVYLLSLLRTLFDLFALIMVSFQKTHTSLLDLHRLAENVAGDMVRSICTVCRSG